MIEMRGPRNEQENVMSCDCKAKSSLRLNYLYEVIYIQVRIRYD
jgi:hypothetical protein